MPRKQGEVETVERKSSRSGKTFYRVQIDRQWYSMWEKPEFAEGQTIAFDEVVKGDFKNIANAEVVTDGAHDNGVRRDAPSAAEAGRAPGRLADGERERRIVRQNATGTAAVVISASKVAGKQDVEALLELLKVTAQRIYDMNMNGYDHNPLPEGKEVGADELFGS